LQLPPAAESRWREGGGGGGGGGGGRRGGGGGGGGGRRVRCVVLGVGGGGWGAPDASQKVTFPRRLASCHSLLAREGKHIQQKGMRAYLSRENFLIFEAGGLGRCIKIKLFVKVVMKKKRNQTECGRKTTIIGRGARQGAPRCKGRGRTTQRKFVAHSIIRIFVR